MPAPRRSGFPAKFPASKAPRAPRRVSVTKELWDPRLDAMDAARTALKAAHPTPRTDGPRDFELVLGFVSPTGTIPTSNKTEKGHWSGTASHRSAWRETARDVAWAHREQLAPLAGCPVEITLAVPRKTEAWIDEQNLFESLGKPILDGIVTAGVLLWEDHAKVEKYTWVELRQTVLYRGDPATDEVRVRIRHYRPEGRWDGSHPGDRPASA